MESGGRASGGGGDVGACSGGHLCHVCGYKYTSAQPSAKQRRAHRKNCGGKPSPSAATVVAEEQGGSGLQDGRKLLLVDGEGERGGGEGSGADGSGSGDGFPGSAQDVANAVAGEGNAEHSFPNGAGVQVIISRSTEGIPSEVVPKANELEIQTEAATQLSESASYLEDLCPSQPSISFEQHLDASTSHCPLKSEDGASLSPELSADDTNKLTVMSLAPNAAAGEIPAQTSTIVGSPGDGAIAKVACMAIAIHDNETSDEVNGSAINSFYQEKLQTEIAGGLNATTVEADPSVQNLSVVYKEEIHSEDTDSNEQNKVILTSSIEQDHIKEPADLFGNEESCTEEHVCEDDTSGDSLIKLGSSDCHLEIADAAKSRQEIDCTSMVGEHTISKHEGQPCPGPDEVIQATPSATGPAVGVEVLSAEDSANLTKKGSSEVTMRDAIQDNASHTDAITFIPQEVDSAEIRTSHEINTVGSKDSVAETRQNQNITADLSSQEMNEVHGIDVETKQCKEDISADTPSHETNEACSTGDFGEQRQNEEIVAEASSHKISIVEDPNETAENEQIEEVNPKPASEKINVMISGDILGEKKQREFYVETTCESNVACAIEHVEEEEQANEEISATCEINTVNTPDNIELKNNENTTKDSTACEISMVNITDNVLEQKQNEESTTDPTRSINEIPSPDEDNKLSEGMTGGPSSHDVVMVHPTDIVTEKNEDSMSGPTSCKVDAVSTTESIQDKVQNKEIAVGPTSHKINVVEQAVDDVEAKMNEERTADLVSRKNGEESNTGDVEEKRQNEEITMDSSSQENKIPQGTDNTGENKQHEEAAAELASDELTAAQSTDDAGEKQVGESAITKMDTTQNAKEDQSEEITDKEMMINSDKSHVSLKALLSEKGVEAKEKKASTKDRVLSFRRRSSKDNVSPTKPGTEQLDWNSPARLPVEKSPKGKKQQWMPFICCPSIK